MTSVHVHARTHTQVLFGVGLSPTLAPWLGMWLAHFFFFFLVTLFKDRRINLKRVSTGDTRGLR